MTKEIHDINTRALDFVVELIEYIFEYPDDDYMTMECLCRKLVKHGLIEKKDGEWTTNFIERKDELQTVVRLKHFKCPKCGRSDYIRSFEDWGIDGGIYKYKCINCNTYIKDEPQTDCSWK